MPWPYCKGVGPPTVKSNRCVLRYRHAAPLVNRLQDRLRDRHRPNAVLAVWQHAGLAVQLTLKGTELQRVGRARREALLGRAGLVAHADHVLRGKAQG